MNGGWGTWTPYASCSVTCGSGTQTRTRNCDTPTPAHGGLQCLKADGTRASTDSESQTCTQPAGCPGKAFTVII